MYHLLSLLESDAAAVVARTATDTELAELQALHQELEAAANPGQRRQRQHRRLLCREMNAFHMRLLEIANNRWRDQMVADLRKVMKLNRHSSLSRPGASRSRCRSTAPSWLPLGARDADATAQRMREHLPTVCRRRRSNSASCGSGFFEPSGLIGGSPDPCPARSKGTTGRTQSEVDRRDAYVAVLHPHLGMR